MSGVQPTDQLARLKSGQSESDGGDSSLTKMAAGFRVAWTCLSVNHPWFFMLSGFVRIIFLVE